MDLRGEIRRQVGILVNRRGKICFVIVGDNKKIVIPHTGEYRAAPGRLKGLRCIHTHLTPESLSEDDLTDLALLIQVAARCFNQEGASLFERDIASHHQFRGKKIDRRLLHFHVYRDAINLLLIAYSLMAAAIACAADCW